MKKPKPIDIKELTDDKLTSLYRMLEQAMHPHCDECNPPWEVVVQHNLIKEELLLRNLI